MLWVQPAAAAARHHCTVTLVKLFTPKILRFCVCAFITNIIIWYWAKGGDALRLRSLWPDGI